MAIPTTRTKVSSEIKIIEEKCNACGLCVSVCSDSDLVIIDSKLKISENPQFGCIGCGHCMAICPSNAIEIYGREISPSDIFTLPKKDSFANNEQLLGLLQHRRSIREFNDIPISDDLIKKILEAAQTAPMGLPPSDVNVLILNGKDKVHSFAKDFSNYLESMKWFFSNWFINLMKPFWGKENNEMFKGFLQPLFHIYTDNMKKDVNVINYDAPLAMYFYGSPYTDPADPIIAATYAMLAAESLGLGTCMLGAVHPFIQNGKKGQQFRESHNIKYKSKEGLFVIFGYPKYKFTKGIKRTFASITYLNNKSNP